MSAPRLSARPPLLGHERRVSSIALTASGRHAVSGSLDRTVRLWNLDEGVCEAVLTGETSDVNAVAVSPDGTIAASGCGAIMLGENRVRIWDLRSKAPARDLTGHQGEVSAVAIHARRGLVVSGSADATVRLWELETGRCLATEPTSGAAFCIAVSADGRRAAAGTYDRRVFLWDLHVPS